MRSKIIALFVGCLLICPLADAEVWQARYGVAETFNFKLYNADGTLDVDEADGGTEVSVSCNEGAETTATNDFVDEGTFYSIALTAAELQCERVAVVVAATTTEVFFIQTNSNASAMTPTNDVNVVNFGGAAGTFASGRPEVNTSHWGGTAVATARPLVDVLLISGDAGAADALETAFDLTTGAVSPLGIVRQGTAQSATATTLVLDTGAAFADDVAIGMTVVACGSTQGYCQSRSVTDSVNSTDTLTVGTWAVTPSGTITYYLFGTAPATGGGGGDLTAADVWAHGTRTLTALDEDNTTIDINATPTGAAASVTGAVGSVTGAVGSVTGAVGSVTGNVGGTVNGLTATAQGNVRTAVGLATANLDTQLGTIDDLLDTEIAAILAEVTPLTFTVTNQLDVNVESQNTHAVCGTGDSGTPWTGCP